VILYSLAGSGSGSTGVVDPPPSPPTTKELSLPKPAFCNFDS